jgi:dipeptidyl aminopeptidase/acylaminoacyl peptidase
MKKSFLTLAVLLMSINIFGDTLTISKWLVVSGPSQKLPAFFSTGNIRGKEFTEKELFSFGNIDLRGHFPQHGVTFQGEPENGSKWVASETDDQGVINLIKPVPGAGTTAWMATYITSERWIKAELEILGRQMFEVYLNGSLLDSKASNEEAEKEPGRIRTTIELPRGKHLLVIRTFHQSDQDSKWQVQGRLILPSYTGVADIGTELHPGQGKNINHLLDGIKASSGSLSPDGKLYAITYSRTLPPSDRSENWIEIKRVSDSKLIHSFRHTSIQAFAWAPAGNVFSYRTSRDGKASVWIHDLDKGRYFAVLEDIENFGTYTWSPDAGFLIYSIREHNENEKEDLRRLLGMQDRLPGYRTRQFLYRVDVSTRIKERLTHGFLSTALHDISPDSKKILFSQVRPDYTERPYSKQDLFLMDIDSREVDTIFKDLLWRVTGMFSPDGKKLLLTGGPSSFGTLGENIQAGRIANNYDTQAYIYDLATKNIDPITRDFDPSVSMAHWNRADKNIYLVAGSEDLVKLYRYNTGTRAFSGIETGEDVLNWITVAEKQPFAMFSGSGMSSPPKVSLLDLKTGRYREIENPEKENFRNVVFGNSTEWEFTDSQGVRIPGRVYLPPGFDDSGEYPLIVYYYGGTNPVSRGFGGRYPFNMYAANGYVVYVLQPSGATGFGQDFSSMHVNNWGTTVADEIISATQRFIDDHSFIDPARVGCMGASYGGFMTMLLLTRTDIFAGAISHAGISSISSYWGVGYWGYSYSAEASAGSFPWNNRELYVDQSPLFNADKINTPILLLHGSSDTNVPVGESLQLYAALRLLGKPVELVEVEGEDHHILTYTKRIAWSNTKLAWFDMLLKKQPEWWENMYPEKNY